MILDVSEALDGLLQTVQLKSVVETTLNFVLSRNATVTDIAAVVQPADLSNEELRPETIDWSREYLMVHSRTVLVVDSFIQYDGRDFRIVKLGRFKDYGYHVAIVEETKQPLILPPPVNTALPVITGDYEVDETLSCSDGVWTGANTILKQWRRDAVAIAGATDDDYLLVAADLDTIVDCVVTAQNDFSYTVVTAAGEVVE